eukprot:5307760-Pleurochrysis_carterae.AAC.1
MSVAASKAPLLFMATQGSTILGEQGSTSTHGGRGSSTIGEQGSTASHGERGSTVHGKRGSPCLLPAHCFLPVHRRDALILQ